MLKVTTAVFISLFLTGCDWEYYRYPCQDPANWNSPECKKPLCEVRQTCPEYIFKQQDDVIRASIDIVERRASAQSKGVCK